MTEYKHLRDNEIELARLAEAAKTAEQEYLANGFSARVPLEIMRFGRKVSPDAILALLSEIDRLRGVEQAAKALISCEEEMTHADPREPKEYFESLADNYNASFEEMRSALEGTDGAH
jgi:UDP-N-acetylmuramyl pentapeptide synthase